MLHVGTWASGAAVLAVAYAVAVIAAHGCCSVAVLYAGCCCGTWVLPCCLWLAVYMGVLLYYRWYSWFIGNFNLTSKCKCRSLLMIQVHYYLSPHALQFNEIRIYYYFKIALRVHIDRHINSE